MAFKFKDDKGKNIDLRMQCGDFRNDGKKGKVKLEYSYGVCVPVCPLCNELAYEDEYCVFCGCEFEPLTEEDKEEEKKLNHELTAQYKGITATQVGTSVYVSKNGQIVEHWNLYKPYETEAELKKALKRSYVND